MKKILLFLSCFLATWCSIQASMIQSVSASSMVLASVPSAAPAPTYPAVINSASLKNGVITVSFTVNSGSKVSFDLEGSGQKKTDVFSKSVSRGSYTVSFNLPQGWSNAFALIIKVDGSPCGGTSLNVPVNPNPNPNSTSQQVYAPSGYISDEVIFVGKSLYDSTPEYAWFKYNLNNTNNPYLYIKEGGVYGTNIVAKIKIENTNGDYKNAFYCSYRSALKENTTYSACLYDVDAQGKAVDLRIYKDFKIPTQYKYSIYATEWHYDENRNQLVIWCNSNVPSGCNVTVRVSKCSNSNYNDPSIHDQRTGNRNEKFYIGIPYPSVAGYYIIELIWPGGESVPLKVCIRR